MYDRDSLEADYDPMVKLRQPVAVLYRIDNNEDKSVSYSIGFSETNPYRDI